MSARTTLEVVREDDGIAVVTLRRPERLNAISDLMWEELRDTAQELDKDDTVRVAVLTGSGRGFCAGLDLEDAAGLASLTMEEMWRLQVRVGDVVTRWKRIGKPVVAAVNGPAAGGGLALALASDVRVAAPSARFGVAFVRLGLSGCDACVSWLLPRIVGLGAASELMLTGRVIDATEALRIGLVNRVVDEDVVEAAREVAREMAANSPYGLRLTKEGLELAVDAPSLDAAVAVENRNQALATRTPDMAEAVRAFIEKRPASFVHE